MTTTTTREVPLNALKLDHPRWRNPRMFTGLSDDDLSAFGKELKERGVLDPPTVQRCMLDGEIVDLVIDGQRRVRAALGAFPKSHKIQVIDRTDKPIEMTVDESDEITLEVLAMGEHRRGLSSFELSAVAEDMRDHKRTNGEIAKAIGRDESWVSKMLKARSTASPKLLVSWRKGQITDEQFKELAALKPDKQDEVTKEVIQTRESGDKAEARQRLKELAEQHKQEERKEKSAKKDAPEPANGKEVTPANGGKQVEMWRQPPPVKKPSTPRHALEEMVELADKRPPTDPYVKGIMDGVRYAIGLLEPDEFGKPWRKYLARIDGSGKPAKKTKKPAKVNVPPKSKQVTLKAAPKKAKKATKKKGK